MTLSVDEIHRWDAAVPRYTSYPTAPEWRDAPDSERVLAALGTIRSPASLYVHVPF